MAPSLREKDGDSFSRRHNLDYRALPIEDNDALQVKGKVWGGRVFQLKDGEIAVEFASGNVRFYDSRVECNVWLKSHALEQLEAAREALSISRKETESIRPKDEEIKESNRTISIRMGEKMNLPKHLQLIGGLMSLGGFSMWILSEVLYWDFQPWSAVVLILGAMIFVYGLVTSRWGDK